MIISNNNCHMYFQYTLPNKRIYFLSLHYQFVQKCNDRAHMYHRYIYLCVEQCYS